MTGCSLAAAGSAMTSFQTIDGSAYVAYLKAPTGPLAILKNTGSSWSCPAFSSAVVSGAQIAGVGLSFPHIFHFVCVGRVCAGAYGLMELHTICDPTCRLYDEYLLHSSGDAPTPTAGIATFVDTRGLHVYYEDSAHHIKEALCSVEQSAVGCPGGGGWVFTDLTALTGSALADPSSPVAAYNDSGCSGHFVGGEHVYYVGSDGHVILLLFNNGTWTMEDTTTNGGSNGALGQLQMASTAGWCSPSGWVYNESLYILHSPTWDFELLGSNTWSHEDVVQRNGWPAAAGNGIVAFFNR